MSDDPCAPRRPRREDAREARQRSQVVAAALYADSTDVRWWYVGGRCLSCKLLGVYVDWKDDGTPWEPQLRDARSGKRRRGRS